MNNDTGRVDPKDSLVRFLKDHPAFRDLLPEQKRSLIEASKLVRFRVGQTIVDSKGIPATVYMLVKGKARLIDNESGRTRTNGFAGVGAFAGIASVICEHALEDSISANEVVAWAIPTEFLVGLLNKPGPFKEWCAKRVFPAELFAIRSRIQRAVANNGRTETSSADIREMTSVRVVDMDEARSLLKDAKDKEEADRIFLATDVTGHPIFSELNAEQLTKVFESARREPRLLAAPADLVSSLSRVSQSSTATRTSDVPSGDTGFDLAPERPLQTDLQLGSNKGTAGFKLIRAKRGIESKVACFQMLAKFFNLPFRRDAIENFLAENLARGQTPNMQTYGRIATGLGLISVPGRVTYDMALRLSIPALVEFDGDLALVIKAHHRGITIASPVHGIKDLNPQALEQEYPSGLEALVFAKTSLERERRFGLSWFTPAITKYKGVLMQVLAASFVVQLFSLANPLLIQVIIDKVISQRSLDTLHVLGLSLVVVAILESILSSLRTFLFTETTNRIDQRLGSEVVDHLLRLPLKYFDLRPVGDLATRIGELEKIRTFLTGTALTTILDSMFSVIYIVVMAFYSVNLTAIALSVVPVQVTITALGAPLFRRQVKSSAEANSKTQSQLVEMLTGIQTIKAQNVELVSRWKWQERYSEYIARTFERVVTSTSLSSISQLLQRLSQLLVIWVGAEMVLNGDLTLGQLIAFRIISGYVTQPLLRLTSIWQNVQEIKVSFERLSDIIDTNMESDEADQGNVAMPLIKGDVVIQDLFFSFNESSRDTLKNINLSIPSGSFVGVVGLSGSGKSTLMKLLPRLYNPRKGRIYIDDYDISKVELYSLRRQIGIVPQDPLLFSGTVSENIALTSPEASMDEIVNAARKACAHDFIMSLPSGYSTKVGERGGLLSGGQRQRIAIARTLLTNPRMLIMDEATSALDYQTERQVCESLLADRSLSTTVFFITHRLPAVIGADVIMFMQDGMVKEMGTHDKLMGLKGGYYALYRQQEAGQ